MSVGTQSINDFLASLASKEPAPGGGAVAGILSALSASLGDMVIAYSLGKKSLQEHAELHNDCSTFMIAAREEAMQLSQADAKVYTALRALWKLPRDTPARIENWENAVNEAISVPLRTMELCARILSSLQTLVGNTNKMLASDLAIGAIAAEAAARSAHWNVRVNLPLLHDNTSDFEVSAIALLTTCIETAKSIETSCAL